MEQLTKDDLKDFIITKQKNKKIGIAFSGGGFRGFAHIGVIKALEEYGLKFDYIAGTSVGSVVGAFYANGYTHEQMLEIGSKIKISDIKPTKIIPAKTKGVEKLLIDSLGGINIEDLQTQFMAVAVDLKTTKECVLSHGNLAKACAGSCAVPGVFEPVKFEDKLLCDGGLRNNLPADVLKKNECNYVISVDVCEEKDQGVKSAKIFDILGCSLKILLHNTSHKGYLSSDIVIYPPLAKFSCFKKDGYLEMVEAGYNATIEAMPKILKLFKRIELYKEKNQNNLKDAVSSFNAKTDKNKTQKNVEKEIVR